MKLSSLQCLLLLLVFFTLLPLPLGQAGAETGTLGGTDQRVGLVEIFTAVWCDPCYNADLAIEDLYNELGAEVAIVAYHPLTNGDPFGLNATPQRFEYYLGPADGPNRDLWGYPTQMINGRADPPLIGAPSVKKVLELQQELLAEDAGRSDYILTSLEPLVTAGNITFWVTAEGPALSRNVTLRVVLTEDNHYWWGTNGDGTPAGSTNGIKIHRWVARHHFQPSALNNGSLNQTYTYTLDPDWETRELGYVAFIQDEDTHEVLQALAYYPNPPVRAATEDSPSPGPAGLLLAGLIALVLISMLSDRTDRVQSPHPVLARPMTGLLVGLVVLSLMLPVVSADMTPTFNAALHDPDRPSAGDTLDITLWLDDTDNVTEVEVLVCSVTKNLCGLPVDMQASDPATNTEWTAQSDWGLEAGHELGYKFTVKTKNGTKHYFPDPEKIDDYAAYDMLDFSGDGDWYFAFQVRGNPGDDDSPGLPLIGTLSALGVAAALSGRRP